MWMASQDGENRLKRAIFNSMFGEDYKFPEQKYTFSSPSKIEAKITTTKNGYEIIVINNEELMETNLPFKYGETLHKSISLMKLYIKTKSGAEFSEGSMSGTVTNKDGIGIVDPSSFYDAKNIAPGGSYTFTVKASGTPDIDDIVSITMTQRIVLSLDEIREQIIYSK